MADKRKLSHDQKQFILERLACFRDARSIIREYQETFEEEIDRRVVAAYNIDLPSTWRDGNPRIHASLVEFFRKVREEYMTGRTVVPIASTVYRLQVAQRNLLRAELAENYVAIAALLKEARADAPVAKGTGDAEHTIRMIHCDASGREIAAASLPLPDRGRG